MILIIYIYILIDINWRFYSRRNISRKINNRIEETIIKYANQASEAYKSSELYELVNITGVALYVKQIT